MSRAWHFITGQGYACHIRVCDTGVYLEIENFHWDFYQKVSLLKTIFSTNPRTQVVDENNIVSFDGK